MQTIQYRRWCPPESPLGIEFPPELLQEVRREGARAATAARLARTRPRDRSQDHSSGVLFGVKQEREVRVLAARSTPNPVDSNLAGMQPVGIFVCRARGEVFLTDRDLALFDAAKGLVALVMVGGQAGFFVRQADGSVQAIRSHEEFTVANVAPRPAPVLIPANLRPVPPPRRLWTRAIKGAGLLCLPVAVFAYMQPEFPQPQLALALHEEAGQLMVQWDVPSQADLGRLEIVDGGERTLIHLAPAQTSVTYRHHTGDIEVRLDTGARQGSARWKQMYYVAETAPAVVDTGDAQDRVLKLEREAKILRAAVAGRRIRTKQLSRHIGRLTGPGR